MNSDNNILNPVQMDYEPEYNFSIGTTPRRPTPEERDPAKVMIYRVFRAFVLACQSRLTDKP